MNKPTKDKVIFFCQSCGNETPKWSGQCSSCKAWNTIVEEKFSKSKSIAQGGAQVWDDFNASSAPAGKAILLKEVVSQDEDRIVTPDAELNRVLGGGIVAGSVVIVAGEPGIGKSTLFLQCALQFNAMKILYVSGEESAQQIKMRADRLGNENENLFLLNATDTNVIFSEIKAIKPDWVIIDSIQTLTSPHIESAAGSVSQVRECAAELQVFAKKTQVPVLIIGHITKDGSIAGPKVLEHVVDTVLQFEGDRNFTYRILRTLKNRFGSTSEIGIYEMTQNGMRGILNPSEILVSQNVDGMSGVAITSSIEGNRPMMIEVQALVSQAVYGNPQRTTNGFDQKRLQLLLAVLEKRGGFHFGMKDVFLNIAGGMKIDSPAIDLAIACALLSSYEDISLPPKVCLVGEIGLSGEIRAVSRIEQRIAEAMKMGLKGIIIPAANLKGLEVDKFDIKIKGVSKVEEVYQILFQNNK